MRGGQINDDPEKVMKVLHKAVADMLGWGNVARWRIWWKWTYRHN